MTKRILFISKGESSSSTRYRALQYFPYFLTAEFKPRHISISGGFFPILKTLIAIKHSDIVILLRKTFPWPIFWLIRKLSKKLIFDFDDAIFCNTDGSYSKTRMHRFKYTVSRCDLIFAGNQYLANQALNFNARTNVIPTSVDAPKYYLDVTKDSNNLILVWIGSQSTKKYLTEILPYLEQSAHNIPNLKLKVIADFSLSSDTLNIENIQWNEKIEAIELCNSHVGIAPMPIDNWTKGKCALKVLQYMAAGLPVLSSDSGVNSQVIEHEHTGLLISDIKQWESSLNKIFSGNFDLKKTGEAGRLKVQSEFAIDVVFKKIIRLIDCL